MPVAPIQARCKRCRRDFYLFELVDRRNTTCPRCGWALTDSPHVLLEEARRVDAAQRALVNALQRVHAAHGVLSILPHTVLRNIFEEVDWQRPFQESETLVNEELAHLDKHREGWLEHRSDVAEDANDRRGWVPKRWRKRRAGKSRFRGVVVPISQARGARERAVLDATRSGSAPRNGAAATEVQPISDGALITK